MAKADSRALGSDHALLSGGQADSADPPAFGSGDDGEFALEAERFWPPEERVDRAARLPSAPKPRYRRGPRSRGNAKPPREVSTAVVDHPLQVTHAVNEPFDVGATGNPALAEYELMEALAGAAARSEDAGQAARLVAAIVPLALRLTPDVSESLWPVLPDLLAAVGQVAELLRRRPANRPLLCLLPMLLRRTAGELRRRLRAKQPVTGPEAAQILTRQAALMFNLRRGQHAAIDDGEGASSTI